MNIKYCHLPNTLYIEAWDRNEMFVAWDRKEISTLFE